MEEDVIIEEEEVEVEVEVEAELGNNGDNGTEEDGAIACGGDDLI